MDPDRAIANDVESVTPTPVQRTTQADSRPTLSNQENDAKQAFY